ncbi:aspartate/glutamate racemase family protein [Bacillus horti]|uniref:Asp/Glu/hydantoin racemase n=1 Tax=Caldalkalibacillus horti TaxID=77523 RepID=A0ABT9W3U9_9BACI|nr:aspartate/glutamate racemase family protein [Bacillus horti]MDQ0167918.1 Asp/Glu/hydantoin racemase [Bacillus horti]
MLGIIRVLTTEDQDVLLEHGQQMQEYLNVKSVTKCIPEQPYGVHDKASEAIAIPKIAQLAQEMKQENDIKVITISCAGDPGLDEASAAVSIPVLGAGVCGARAAKLAGSKVGIIGITEAPPERMKRELGDSFHSYTYEPNLRKATDLFAVDASEKLYHKVSELIAGGADVILFACTGFSTIKLKDYLSRHLEVPIIDLVEAQAVEFRLIVGEAE